MTIHKTAVVGAGMSGLSAAATLTDQGFDVQIFEKSRGCGGRMATRRASGFEFDHGAQYFTVRDEWFGKAVEGWIREGVAAPWKGKVAVIDDGQISLKSERRLRYVGTPRMNSIVRHLAAGMEMELKTRITGLRRTNRGWQLLSDPPGYSGYYDSVVLTIPPAQASELLDSQHPLQRFLEWPMQPCWAVMMVFEWSLDLPFDAAFVNNSSVSWISRNSSKPERGNEECWVVHGSPYWSREHLETEPEWVARSLLSELFRQIDCPTVEASWLKAHRWRYAQSAEPQQKDCFWDSDDRLGLCGDWCNGSRVEGAFLSGKSLAEKIIESS